MKQLTHRQYDALESAITHGRRVAIFRRGTEFVVVPKRLWSDGPREAVDVLHPTTGEEMTLFLDEIDRLDVVAR
ncbi:MAG: hypothetical protein H0T48_06110 [Gemmatimonadaceae bacterium]|nr:hypothetical protein [Gemmatimonadaceae bacterium]